MDTGKRFAIRFSDGTYSSGPKMSRVPIDKAKLWTNIGHLKNHLNGLRTQEVKGYLPDAQVVEVEVTYTERDLTSVAELLAESSENAAKRKVKQRPE